jgi:hypothetical protein
MQIYDQKDASLFKNRNGLSSQSHQNNNEKVSADSSQRESDLGAVSAKESSDASSQTVETIPDSLSSMLLWLISSGQFLPGPNQVEPVNGEKSNGEPKKASGSQNGTKNGKPKPSQKELIAKARQLAQTRLGSDLAATSSLFPDITHQQLLNQIIARLDALSSTTSTEVKDITNVQSWWYCGPTAMIHNFLWFEPLKYVETVIDLYQKGEAKPGKSRLRVTKSMKSINISGGEASDKGTGDFTDWLLIEALRSAENDWFAPKEITDRGEAWQTGTLPWEIDDMARRLGLKPHGGNAYVATNLRKIEKELEKGNLIVVLDNGLFYSGGKQDNYMLPSNKADKENGINMLGIHYLTIHAIDIDRETKMVSATYWEHGLQSVKEVSFKVFKKAMKAQYYIGKKK